MDHGENQFSKQGGKPTSFGERQGNVAKISLSSLSALDIADTGVEEGNVVENNDRQRGWEPGKGLAASKKPAPGRPQIQRNQSQPAPLQQPPPPPTSPQDQLGNATDSLSLSQLRRIVTEMPRLESNAYAFVYDDANSFQQELSEWFLYTEEDLSVLVRAKTVFDKEWRSFTSEKLPGDMGGVGWIDVDAVTREDFLRRKLADLKVAGDEERKSSLQCLLYIGLGAWEETASNEREEDEVISPQIEWMLDNAILIEQAGGIDAAYEILRQISLREWDDTQAFSEHASTDSQKISAEVEDLNNALTIMYLFVETARLQMRERKGTSLRDGLAKLQPGLLIFLIKLVAKLRWDDTMMLPLNRILLLLWKAILTLFGGSKELRETKIATREDKGRSTEDEVKTLITASPLDYHMFRQEITSKYPAYNPPPPLVPLEADSNSILPPATSSLGRIGNDLPRGGIGPANINSDSNSILLQPVHIATPAPSPPPSPVGPGGKAGKKQNYQTNQNFPFLYPPLDVAGGESVNSGRFPDRASAEKWKGGDVPASILEAGELFAGRMRMSRSLKQLWDERERYMEFERGWASADVDHNPDSLRREDQAVSNHIDPDVTRRLEMIEEFYKNALPHLQSLVIVLRNVILANVTTVFTQPNQGLAQDGLAAPFHSQEPTNGNDLAQGKPRENSGRSAERSAEGGNKDGEEIATIEELDAARSREITAKAVSGLLLLLLKWFKISHVLKFEFLTQLLLDSNYLLLILRLFAQQEVDKAVDSITDREELSFFAFCALQSRRTTAGRYHDPEGDDDACPPPIIKRRRESASASATSAQPDGATDTAASEKRMPYTDELGCHIPSEPIRTFSWRNFFSNINFLRIMQKICKHKAHRNLLLVQYKSSTILKKSLKVPQPELRLYTLKLFKNQVPYCGRKWRQTNMRVITAVYLHCRPELRDDWLAGSDVDAEVEEAVPLEQSLRTLTHWHNLRRYPDELGADLSVLEDEQDFFVRELERMDIGDSDGAAEETHREGLWEGSLQVDAW